jgi:Kef-type K+ transport system membrane component KefB
LGSAQLWLIFAALLVAAVAGKWIGCGLAAWLAGFKPREASCIGAMMNTRGLMELIVINVGYELHVIPKSVYCMLVVISLLTNLITTPAVMWLSPGTELEASIRKSGFLSRSGEEANDVSDAVAR